MTNLNYIASELKSEGLVVHLSNSDVKVSFAGATALIWITEDFDGIGATLFAGHDDWNNDWQLEEELFLYHNPKAVVEAIKRTIVKRELY
jgi:hypothetical protein